MNVFKFQQFEVRQDHAAMKVGTDSDLLGTLAAGGTRILDVGTGTGVLSLMLAQRFPEASICAVEVDEAAVIDAKYNFEHSRFSDRIELFHKSFQEFLSDSDCPEAAFDCIVCNPPYFDKSLECDNLSKTRARHSSSLPFHVLAKGAYYLLREGGKFSVCIPPEVLGVFKRTCIEAGLSLEIIYKVKSVPDKEPKRYVLVYNKGAVDRISEVDCCMRNADRTRSQWYKELMRNFLVNPALV